MSELATILLRALRSGARAVGDGCTVLGVAFYGGWAVGVQHNPAPLDANDDNSIIRESARGITEIESMLRGDRDSGGTTPPLPSQRRLNSPPTPGEPL